MSFIRLDRIISELLNITRNEAKAIIKSGRIQIDGEIVKLVDFKFDAEKSEILLDSNPLKYKKYTYIMMNKPVGVVSATTDSQTTVLDILPDELKRAGLFPVGRLDKDTTGLMIITNDGNFSHRVTSPKSNVTKRYVAKLENPITQNDIFALESGITLSDGTVCSGAEIEVLDNDCNIIEIGINEGKYHQVKRMFAAVNNKVISLHRFSIGLLQLDDKLELSHSREMATDELLLIFKG